jgi:hypothetical protein
MRERESAHRHARPKDHLMRPFFLPVIAVSSLLLGSLAIAEDLPSRGGRINNLKVLSDKIDDVTTLDNIVRSAVKPGMEDAERAKALWATIVKYRHQTLPPNEYLAADWEAHDPVKIFNVYGYCMCCCTSAMIESLNRADGRQARGRILKGHSVGETFYGGGWHMYDPSLIAVFPKPGTGEAASVDEIVDSISAWHAQNPGYQGNPARLVELMRSDSWQGWQARGPKLLASCPYYQQGYLPARTHGWDATMQEYGAPSNVYEYGYQVGHRALFSLRPGESLVRESGNRGLHINQEKQPKWDVLNAHAPQKDLVYLKDFFPAYRGGVVGNGYHRYVPDLASGGLASGAEVCDNLAFGGSPAMHLKSSDKPGIAIVEMSSPYVYLGGRLKLKAMRTAESDRVAVSISTNHGRTFIPLWTADKTGVSEVEVDLTASIRRHYAYWLKIEISAGSPANAGLEALSIGNNIQHAPRTLPFLTKGKNTITVASDIDPAIASRAFTGRITADVNFAENTTAAALGVVVENLDSKHESYWWTKGTGTMTVPLQTPGPMTAIHFGAHVRARGEKDVVRMSLSFDDGQNWTEGGAIQGPTQGRTEYFRLADIPPGKTKALLRYEFSGNNTIGILSFRADVDYHDPLASQVARPFIVTHRWNEQGVEKSHRAVVNRLPSTYTISAANDPEMISVSYEMSAK